MLYFYDDTASRPSNIILYPSQPLHPTARPPEGMQSTGYSPRHVVLHQRQRRPQSARLQSAHSSARQMFTAGPGSVIPLRAHAWKEPGARVLANTICNELPTPFDRRKMLCSSYGPSADEAMGRRSVPRTSAMKLMCPTLPHSGAETAAGEHVGVSSTRLRDPTSGQQADDSRRRTATLATHGLRPRPATASARNGTRHQPAPHSPEAYFTTMFHNPLTAHKRPCSAAERLAYFFTGVQPHPMPLPTPRTDPTVVGLADAARDEVNHAIEEREAAISALRRLLPVPHNAVACAEATRKLLLSEVAVAQLRQELASMLRVICGSGVRLCTALKKWRGLMCQATDVYAALPYV